MTTGKRILAERKKRKLTQIDLAKKAGVATSTIQRYEQQERDPNVETLRKIARALGVPLYDLIDSHEPNNNQLARIMSALEELTDEIRKMMEV